MAAETTAASAAKEAAGLPSTSSCDLASSSQASAAAASHPAATPVTEYDKSGSSSCSYFSLFRYADQKDVWCIVIGSLGAAASGAALPVFAFLFGRIVNNIGGLSGANLVSQVDNTVLYLVYLAIGSFVASFLEMGLWMLTGFRQTVRIRQAYLRSALRQEISFFDTQATTGELLQGLNELANTIQSGIGEKAGNTLHHLATFAAGFAIAFSQGWDMTLVLLAVTPLLAAVGTAIALVLGRMDTKANVAYARANGVAQETLANVRTVIAFNGQDYAVRRYLNTLTQPVRTGVKGGFLNGVTVGATTFTFLGSYALALWYGGLRIRDGAYDGGEVLSVLLSALLGGFALGQAAPNFQYFARACAAGGKCFALIERQPQLGSPSCSPLDSDAPASSTLELRGVDFAYPTRPEVMVACDLNILVPAGHTVALVGESGSGKSTAIALAQRFYDPIKGQVLLDSRDIRGVPLGWLRSQLALVSQEPALFACTIRENILYGNPAATQKDVERAAKDANAHKFICELPKGYDTLVGEKGTAISGGQKQRIAIARAVIRSPRVLLLDEATAALDARSERIVQAALERLMRGRTTLIVAHRLSTVIGAKKIFVMSKGRVIESGRHIDLISKEHGAYATLMRLQQALPEAHPGDAMALQPSAAAELQLEPDELASQPDESAYRECITRSAASHEDAVTRDMLSSGKDHSLEPNGRIFNVQRPATAAAVLVADNPAMERGHSGGRLAGIRGLIKKCCRLGKPSARARPAVDASPEDLSEDARGQDAGMKPELSAPACDDMDTPPSPVKTSGPGTELTGHPTGEATGQGVGTASQKLLKQAGGKQAETELPAHPVVLAEAKEPQASASFGRLLGYNRREWRSAIGGSLSSAGLGVVPPIFALAMATIVSSFYSTDYSYMKHTIAVWAGVYAAIGFAAFCLSILQQGLFTLMGQKLTRRMRKLMFAAALRQEVGWFDREENQSGALASRLAVDTSRIRGAVGDQLGLLAQNLVTLIAAYIIAFIASWKMTLVITATVPIIAIAGFFQAKFLLGSNVKAEKVFDQANQMAAEAFVNIRTVAAFMLDGRIVQLYQQYLAQPAKDSFKQSMASGAGYAIGQGVIFLVYALSFWYGGKLVGEGNITFDQMLKVFFAITLAAVGFSQAQIAFPDITKASSAIAKVFTVIDRAPKISDAPDVAELSKLDGHVSLRDICFAYPQRPEVLVLKNFNLEAPAGRSLALVGPSGNGKSTIVSLIERFYIPNAGQVMVDEVDISRLPLRWWRDHIGLVSQEPVLFSGTILDNLTFGLEGAEPDAIASACEVANARSFIRAAPDGLDSKIGEGGGIQLSGGQKQRIAIARAVLRDPRILLLDEATSALDAVSEQVVQQALNRVSQGRTTITIAHRLSTIWDSDSIAVIQSGCVLEQGTHRELSQIPGGAYASLLMSQQAGFALTK